MAGDAAGYGGNAISPARSALTGQPFAYQPQSALLQSVQQQGVLGTLGAGIVGAVRSAPGIGLIAALGAPNRNWETVGGQVFNTGAAVCGAAASMRGPYVVDFSTGESFAPGYYRADPSQLRFMQPTVSPNFSTGGTIDSLASDLRAGRLTPDEVKGGPLRVVMMDGQPFSFDHRRLVSYNLAGVSDVPIQVMGLNDAVFAAKVRDRFNPVRGEGLQVVVTPSGPNNVIRNSVISDLYDLGLVSRRK